MAARTNSSAHDRRKPKQRRGIETYERILAAAAELFAQQGYDSTTTHQVAAGAGVSVGTLYRYFSDKAALFRELYEREFDERRTRLLEGFDVADLAFGSAKQLISMTLKLAFRVYSERPQLRRELRERARRMPELDEVRRAQEAELNQAVQLILRAVPGLELADVEVSAYIVTLFIESLLDDFVLYRSKDYADERVIHAATDFVLAGVGYARS